MAEAGKGRKGIPLFDGETALIQSIFAPLAQNAEGAFGLHDDAALHTPPPGHSLVLTADMIVEGVHFPRQCDPAEIGYKALAVNISDLVAKGAEPAVYLLSLSLHEKPETAWLEKLAQGLAAAQSDFACALVGGDTVRSSGPVTLSITAVGHAPEGTMLRRSGARAGDRVYVTGTIGDAAAGLALVEERIAPGAAMLDTEARRFLLERYYRPKPSPALVPVLREYASAAMDISDGLVLDFSRLCSASGCGGVIEAEAVPLSSAVKFLIGDGSFTLEEALGGGDDYEVLFTVPPEKTDAFEAAVKKAGLKTVAIGQMTSNKDVQVLGKDGAPVQMSRGGYDHF